MILNCPICGEPVRQVTPVRHLPHFFKCQNCSGYFNDDENSNPTYQETYFADKKRPTFLGTWISKFLDLYLLTYERKIKNLIRSHDARILDYGCGKGKFMAFLRNKGLNVEGYEPSVSARDLAHENKLPVFSEIPSQKYDLVMFWHSLEHTDHPLRDLEKLKEHLSPESQLLIAVPNGDSLEALAVGEKWFGYDWPFHRIHFNHASLEKMLDNIGFKITSTDNWNLNYTVSSLVQSFLNLFFEKNFLYSVVTNRRVMHSKTTILIGGFISLLILLIASPLLIFFFLLELITKRTATMIIVAEPILTARTTPRLE